MALPLLGKKPLPYSTRSVEDIYSDIHDTEEELEYIGAEEVFDEFERTGFSVGKADPEEFKKANAAYKKAVNERDNLLDLIKHGYMKWVDGDEREHATKQNTSDYYYYVNEECLEIMQKGWWQFSAPLSDEHKAL